MSIPLESNGCRFEAHHDWARLPEGLHFKESPDVAVDDQDRVHVFNRGDRPVTVFDRDGQFLFAWGESLFANPHGLTYWNGLLYAVDNSLHCLRVCTLDGTVVRTIGTPGEPAPRDSGKPFNMPTKVAVDPRNGDLLVADGYGNARVHRFSADGRHLDSWGDYGTDPGQFNLVHSLVVDDEGRLYIADRENGRVQVFDDGGRFLDQWINMHRPCGLCLKGGFVYVGQLATSPVDSRTNPNIGACVSIHDLAGRRLARLGDRHAGIGPGQFTAPHGLALDSHGDLYVGEVSFAEYGRTLNPPLEVRSLTKLVRLPDGGSESNES